MYLCSANKIINHSKLQVMETTKVYQPALEQVTSKEEALIENFSNQLDEFDHETQQIVIKTTKGEAVIEDTDEGLAMVSMEQDFCVVGWGQITAKFACLVAQGMVKATFIDAL